jgi:hypothetical protein
MPGGVTGKAREGIPMSIHLSFGTHLQQCIADFGLPIKKCVTFFKVEQNRNPSKKARAFSRESHAMLL